jgi:hypothetical protein
MTSSWLKRSYLHSKTEIHSLEIENGMLSIIKEENDIDYDIYFTSNDEEVIWICKEADLEFAKELAEDFKVAAGF